jgi:hypothetical protein
MGSNSSECRFPAISAWLSMPPSIESATEQSSVEVSRASIFKTGAEKR